MKVRYVGHSGFLVEWRACYWLFDYYFGKLPELDAGKRVFVLASHKHGDHWNPRVLEFRHEHPDVHYMLSSDIQLPKEDWVSKVVTRLEPDGQYELRDGDGQTILLTTLRSTDEGVAFLLDYLGKSVYHAGDLNLWVWKEESEQYNKEMKASFDEQMARLKDIVIDVAFVPLDPRQEEYYYLGLEALLERAKVKRVFPMHFGRDFSVIERYRKERTGNLRETVLMDIRHVGEEWEIEL
jgi:L-ascorbate metabolism protein UlaG (beta-lactamase superfamily)